MASLIEALAERLGTTPDRARKRLRTLLAALDSRVERKGRTSLPGLGTLSRTDGEWSFTPADALGRSVNRTFGDLDPLDVPAPDAETPSASSSSASSSFEEETAADTHPESEPDGDPAEETPPAGTSSAETPTEEAPASSSIFDDSTETSPAHADESIRGLFSQEETQAEPPEAEPDETALPERPPVLSGSETTPEEDADRDRPQERDETQEPSPFAPEAAGSPEASLETSPGDSDPSEGRLPSWSYAALPAGYLIHRRISLSPDDVRGGRLLPSSGGPRRADDRAPRPSTDAVDADAATSREATSSGLGLGGILGILLLLALLGLGVWYVLGQQGIAPGPVAVLQGEAGGEETSGEEAAPGPAPSPGGNAAAADTASTGAGADPSGAAGQSPRARAFAEAARLDADAGGWSLVVASETSREAAERVAGQYAQRFESQDFPVDILETTVDGTQRYRVVVGQFSSSSQATQTLQQNADRFPGDAWSLPL